MGVQRRGAVPRRRLRHAGGGRGRIARNSLTGVLTAYPLDRGVHEWAVEQGIFRADKQLDARLIGSFTSASQEHYHYEDGVRIA
jgi:hypothetical protein